MSNLPLKAKSYISLTILAGLAVLGYNILHWDCPDPTRYIAFLLISLLVSGFKVNLPGINGTMSVNFLFILISLVEMRLPEVLVMGCAGALVQCTWRAKSHLKPIQVLFSATSMALAITASYGSYHWMLTPKFGFRLPLLLGLVACTFFVSNTIQVATVVSLTEKKSMLKIWKECYFWCFPYYLIGAAIAGLLSTLNRFVGWHTSLLVLPVLYWIYRSYRLYLERLDAEKKHVNEMAGLHLRTIEALALAIEAKDYTTHSHLKRVQIYATEIGKEIGLSDPELEALRAAALLHDIGKLAVPEHIISKPGKLTPMEFEKVKIHPVVGGEILERVAFPYPVAPIVRSHHEKWDGSGYPAGLQGEEIPIGARILSVVDCLDALTSDRQYRRALPLAEAMAKVRSEAGKSFDPRVVEILSERYHDLERMVRSLPATSSVLSKDLKVEKGLAPAAGFERSEVEARDVESDSALDFLSSIAAARQEAQALFELTQNLGNSLSLDETLSVLALRLKRMIPYDTIAIYLRREGNLIPGYVSGEDFRVFSALEIPLGQGLAGWVAENKRPIVNGNPAVEPGYRRGQKISSLRSALAVPLEAVSGVVGVLTLYHAEKDFFTKDHLRILQAIADKVALSVENALKYRQAEHCATTDALTGLPNASSLFLHLDRELARCKRLNIPLSVLVCDLDGFKQVNDRFGHLEGNKVLQAVARGLRETCREYDYVARMGGDEFVVVLPGHRTDAVEAKTRRLAAAASEAGAEICGTGILSLSVGGAFYPDDGADAEQLLAEADRRMYKVKQKLVPNVEKWDLGWHTVAVQ